MAQGLVLEELSGTCNNGFNPTANPLTAATNAVKSAARLTKAEYFKLLVNIDKQLLKSAAAKGNTLNGLSGSDHNALDQSLQNLLATNITDADIDAMILSKVNANLSGMGFSVKMPKFVTDAAASVKATTAKVVTAVEKVAQKAVDVIHKAVTLPLRAVVTAALSIFKGPTSKAFLYAFVPDNSPLMANPEVKRKAAVQKKFLDVLRKGADFEPGYLQKHIANDIQSTYGKTPEQVIQDMIAKKDGDLQGLGKVDLTKVIDVAKVAVPLLGVLLPIVISFLPKKTDLPASTDIVKPVPNTPVTTQPGKNTPMSTGMKVGIAAGALLLVGGGIYVATKKNKKNK
jgi:hypothetical protein